MERPCTLHVCGRPGSVRIHGTQARLRRRAFLRVPFVEDILNLLSY